MGTELIVAIAAALVAGLVLGWLFWEEIPTVWTYAGAAVIIASGIYIVLRETRPAVREV